MTHDFAKNWPTPEPERKPVRPAATLPAWMLVAAGATLGLTVGVTATVLWYRLTPSPATVPSLPGTVAEAVTPDDGNEPNPNTVADDDAAADGDTTEAADTAELELEFYTALSDYEVVVDATPMELTEEEAMEANPYLVQSGAFQRLELAYAAMLRQQRLGLNVRLRQQESQGRVLYLLHSGPYRSIEALEAAEQVLRQNGIHNLRLRPR